MLYGYIKSDRTDLAPEFTTSSTIQALGALNNSDGHIINFDLEPFNQLTLNSCVANSTAMAFQILYFKKTGKAIELSRLFLYFNGRNYDGTTDQNVGMFIHNLFKSLKFLGCPLESEWAYDVNKYTEQPPVQAYKAADDFTIEGFYQLTTSGKERCDQIVAALLADHPVVFGTEVGNNLEQYDGSDIVLTIPTENLGGHAQVVVGYRTNSSGKREFLIMNSWGKSWGQSGKYWMSEDYMGWAGTSDIFVASLVPDLLA
jgi:C1A family cysteine protease